ncbi:hypothetical protein KP509_14G012500 [Ceratopteris richardii]|uniref:Uncharacterized protein n=1 Tax=Ceratopteris richardii TaxID=49495 RepID=A0A8T2TAP7_CERRI|nr:hypothetical protein KP509_14G012500 [Ceratopteris richardii]
MSWRDSSFRDFLRFGFPSSSWSAPFRGSAESGEESSRPSPQPEDGCSYTKVVKSRCFLDRNSEGKPVKRCEKTEQLLRNCIGKQQEIIESKSLCTEEEVPNGWTMDSSSEEGILPLPHELSPHSQSPWNPFQGADPFSRGLSDGFESFMQSMEEMMNDAMNQLGFYRREDDNARNHPGRSQRLFPESRNKHEDDSSTAPWSAHKKVDVGNSRNFDEV